MTRMIFVNLPVQDMGFVDGCGFEGPDGHLFEPS